MTCTPSKETTETIGNDLFGKPDYIKLQNGFSFARFHQVQLLIQ